MSEHKIRKKIKDIDQEIESHEKELRRLKKKRSILRSSQKLPENHFQPIIRERIKQLKI